MPLPIVGNIVTPPNPTTLGAALNNHPPVTGGNEEHKAKTGNAAWAGATLNVSNVGVSNYWYIPASVNKVSFGVVPCAGGGEAYVISDQYGGCEYHELYNVNYNMLAFLHIYRGDGIITPYTLGAGWVLRSTKRSAVIAQQFGMTGSNWSVSLVNRTNNPPTVQSKFIHVGGWPAITVQGEDNGDTAYPVRGLWDRLFG
jgi:hypothetical protein